jgi:hypothetical protein
MVWWAMAVGVVAGCVVNFKTGISGYDFFTAFYPQAHKLVDIQFAHMPWLFLILFPICQVPIIWAFALFNILNVIIIRTCSWLRQVNPYRLLLSFPAFWLLWFGQVDAFIILGAALGIWAVEHKRPYLTGFAILLMLIKPHLGAGLAVAYIIWSRPRWRVLVPIVGMGILSLVIWGWDWPLEWVRNIFVYKDVFVSQKVNIDLFPYGVLAWVAVLTPVSRQSRCILIYSATLLSVPYAPIYAVFPLYIFPLPWWIYLFPYLGLGGSMFYPLITLMPLTSMVWVLFSEGRAQNWLRLEKGD